MVSNLTMSLGVTAEAGSLLKGHPFHAVHWGGTGGQQLRKGMYVLDQMHGPGEKSHCFALP